ncbi:ATPase, F1/V1/A1 complex, alpha/beta subunit [Tanacetum coccineum]
MSKQTSISLTISLKRALANTSSTSLKKEELTRVPVWVKLHDVSIVAFTADGLRAIATKIDKPLMLDSFTSTMCNELWGQNSYAHTMIEVSAENILKDSMVIAILNLKDEGYKPVSKNNGATTSGTKNNTETPSQETSCSNPFDALRAVENDDLLGANGVQLAHEQPTSNVSGMSYEDSDDEVEEVVNETTCFMASKSGSGIERKSLYEH